MSACRRASWSWPLRIREGSSRHEPPLSKPILGLSRRENEARGPSLGDRFGYVKAQHMRGGVTWTNDLHNRQRKVGCAWSGARGVDGCKH